jgi:hypothetical protein
MTGRDVVKTAFDLKESARIPITLIAGGSWAVHMAGETFAGIKENPERIADVFVQAFMFWLWDAISPKTYLLRISKPSCH